MAASSNLYSITGVSNDNILSKPSLFLDDAIQTEFSGSAKDAKYVSRFPTHDNKTTTSTVVLSPVWMRHNVLRPGNST